MIEKVYSGRNGEYWWWLSQTFDWFGVTGSLTRRCGVRWRRGEERRDIMFSGNYLFVFCQNLSVLLTCVLANQITLNLILTQCWHNFQESMMIWNESAALRPASFGLAQSLCFCSQILQLTWKSEMGWRIWLMLLCSHLAPSIPISQSNMFILQVTSEQCFTKCLSKCQWKRCQYYALWKEEWHWRVTSRT